MGKTYRYGYTAAEKAELWERFRQGESFEAIDDALRKEHGAVRMAVSRRGGIPPAAKIRNRIHLSLIERERISRGLASGQSFRAIAEELGRSPSTISREVARHGGPKRYRAIAADKRAYRNARRPKLCKLALNSRLRRIVAKRLALDWSPAQISGWLRMTFAGDEKSQISHETIYRSLYIQTRGVLKKELMKHLRTGRTMRRSKAKATKGTGRGKIVDAVSIHDRPPEVDDRAILGHWEGDLIAGSNHTYLATLVERTSRYTLLIKVKGKHTRFVVPALTKKIKVLPGDLRRTLTWDRGSEMSSFKKFSVATDVDVYFCDP